METRMHSVSFYNQTYQYSVKLRVLNSNITKIWRHILSHCINVNWIWFRVLKWTYAPELLRCPDISLSIVNTNLGCVNSVNHIRASELFLMRERTYTFEQIYKVTCSFRYRTRFAVKITFYIFVHQHNQCKFQN